MINNKFYEVGSIEMGLPVNNRKCVPIEYSVWLGFWNAGD